MRSFVIRLKLDFMHHTRGFRRAEETGETFASPTCLILSLSKTFFTSWALGGVLAVRGLPLWVGPGLALLLQLLTVPLANCFLQSLQIVVGSGTLAPGNLFWKSVRRPGIKFLVPFLSLVYWVLRSLLSHGKESRLEIWSSIFIKSSTWSPELEEAEVSLDTPVIMSSNSGIAHLFIRMSLNIFLVHWLPSLLFIISTWY